MYTIIGMYIVKFFLFKFYKKLFNYLSFNKILIHFRLFY